MPIKYEKTAIDEDIEKRDLLTNRTLKHLKDLSFYKFNIGDVLICEELEGKQWKVKKSMCGLPYRYVYVFENSLGIGYIRRLAINGKNFVETPVCVVNYDPSSTRFKLDSNYADSILIGEGAGFDPQSEYKEVKRRRERAIRANKKLRINTRKREDALAFLLTLKLGDTVWIGWGPTHVDKNVHTVVNVHYDGDNSFLELSNLGNFQRFFNLDRISYMWWFKSQPVSVDEQL